MNARTTLAAIIRKAGGVVDEDDRFVTRPGVQIMSVSAPTKAAREIMDLLGHDTDLEPADRLTAFDARVTYLAFPNSGDETGEAYLQRIHGLGHTSIWGRTFASILFAGISVETSMEIVAHPWMKVARLTTSATKAMDDPLFRLFGTQEEVAAQRRTLQSFLESRAQVDREAVGGRYAANRLDPGCKATLLHVGATLVEWNWVFGSRLVKVGNEPEVREAFALACVALHQRYPFIIERPREYGYEEESSFVLS